MKFRTSAGLLILFLFLTISIFCVNSLYKLREEIWHEEIGHFANLDKNVAKGITLEYNGLASDYLMLKTLTFMGAKLIEEKQLTSKEWQMVYLALNQVTNLDPRFMDPYVVAEMSLPWDAGMVEETNELLKKAIQARPEDHRPFFFLWYNYYYFLNDTKTAAQYLQQAAQKSGAPPYYASLAARMHLISGELMNSIVFLEQMITEATDPKIIKHFKKRLEVTKKLAFLEHKMKMYREKFHKIPEKIGDLITPGILQEIPTDPYGGQFYIMENGRIYTTSDMVSSQQNKKVPTKKLNSHVE